MRALSLHVGHCTGSCPMHICLGNLGDLLGPQDVYAFKRTGDGLQPCRVISIVHRYARMCTLCVDKCSAHRRMLASLMACLKGVSVCCKGCLVAFSHRDSCVSVVCVYVPNNPGSPDVSAC
jgi:hypothetical protein